MAVFRGTSAVSGLSLLLLLLVAGVVGALFSYMFVMGYYVSIGFRVPEKPSIAIVDATFPAQNASLFDVTVLNPSSSPSSATIEWIAVTIENNVLYFMEGGKVTPPLPYRIEPGDLKVFRCLWDWSNHTDETIGVLVFMEEQGSGATVWADTPFMRINVTDVLFNATYPTRFNVTVENQGEEYVNVTMITVTTEDGTTLTVTEVTPDLPHTLLPEGPSVTFNCTYDWTDYRNRSLTVTVETLQGYRDHYPQVTPPPVNLTITDALFDPADTTFFNLTLRNSMPPSAHIEITNITVTVENETTQDIAGVSPNLPYVLPPNTSENFTCFWNWTDYRNKTVTIAVHHLQGHPTSYPPLVTPPLVILNVTEAIFNTDHFNVTVRSSERSTIPVNITSVVLKVEVEYGPVENITDVVTSENESLPYQLEPDRSVILICRPTCLPCLRGETVTVTVYTKQGYTASLTTTIPTP